jgi:hypothetical protein
MSNFNEIIETLAARHAKLSAVQFSNVQAELVIKCGVMCIAIKGDRSNACGAEYATIFNDRASAVSFAKRISNGAGERGRVVSYRVAVAEEIGTVAASLAALREAVAAQA